MKRIETVYGEINKQKVKWNCVLIINKKNVV